MKSYWLTAIFGVAVVLNGCGTTSGMAKSQGTSSSGPSPLVQAFSPLGDVSQVGNGIKITLAGDSLFKVGHSRLSEEGIQKIGSVAAALEKFPGDHAAVAEYTDNSGKSSRNIALSRRRAEAIKGELVKKGVPADNVTADGNGDADPLAANDTPEGRAKNRRVEIEINPI